ncbi:hypothetical protein ACTFIY_009442 [Dictyostelium cf. discoideum]
MLNQEEKEINKLSSVFVGKLENDEINENKNQVVISIGMKKKDKKELIKSIQESNGNINEISIKLSKNTNTTITEEKDKIIDELEMKIKEMELKLKEMKLRSKKQNLRIRKQDNLIIEMNNKINNIIINSSSIITTQTKDSNYINNNNNNNNNNSI